MAAATDLTCVKCRYALRGLDARGRCPECGERIRRSAAAVRLARRAREKRPKGVIPAAEAVVNAIVGLYLLGYIAAVIEVRSRRPPGPVSDHEPYVIAGLLVGVCLLLTWSSFRRSESLLRAFAALCALPAILGAYKWFGFLLYWFSYAWF